MKNITPSVTASFNNRVSQLRDSGIQIYGFNVGEPDFPVPQEVRETIKNSIDEGKTKYTAVSGIKPLKESIIKKLKRENSLNYNLDQVCVTCGVKQALHDLFLSLCDEGDEVIIPTPCWVSYVEIVKLAGAKPVIVKTKKDYHLDLEEIEKHLTFNTKTIVINTPNNPTGVVYSREELQQLADLAITYNFYIISDEIYEKIIYDNHKHFSIGSLNDEIFERTITLNGFSKAYAMTGLRLGYITGPSDVIKNVCTLQSHNTSNAPTPIQWGGVTALEKCDRTIEAMRDVFQKRRDLLVKKLKALENVSFIEPEGAFYLLLDVSKYLKNNMTTSDLCNYLLEEGHVAFVPGESFFANNCIRISFATNEDIIEEGIDILIKKLKEL